MHKITVEKESSWKHKGGKNNFESPHILANYPPPLLMLAYLIFVGLVLHGEFYSTNIISLLNVSLRIVRVDKLSVPLDLASEFSGVRPSSLLRN
jgi:hypothetical protein